MLEEACRRHRYLRMCPNKHMHTPAGAPDEEVRRTGHGVSPVGLPTRVPARLRAISKAESQGKLSPPKQTVLIGIFSDCRRTSRTGQTATSRTSSLPAASLAGWTGKWRYAHAAEALLAIRAHVGARLGASQTCTV